MKYLNTKNIFIFSFFTGIFNTLKYDTHFSFRITDLGSMVDFLDAPATDINFFDLKFLSHINHVVNQVNLKNSMAMGVDSPLFNRIQFFAQLGFLTEGSLLELGRLYKNTFYSIKNVICASRKRDRLEQYFQNTYNMGLTGISRKIAKYCDNLRRCDNVNTFISSGLAFRMSKRTSLLFKETVFLCPSSNLHSTKNCHVGLSMFGIVFYIQVIDLIDTIAGFISAKSREARKYNQEESPLFDFKTVSIYLGRY